MSDFDASDDNQLSPPDEQSVEQNPLSPPDEQSAEQNPLSPPDGQSVEQNPLSPPDEQPADTNALPEKTGEQQLGTPEQPEYGQSGVPTPSGLTQPEFTPPEYPANVGPGYPHQEYASSSASDYGQQASYAPKYTKPPTDRKKITKIVIAAVAGVAVVAAVFSGGFGLFRLGAWSSPQAVAATIVDEAIKGLNSVELVSVLDKPLSSLNSADNPIMAPSETALFANSLISLPDDSIAKILGITDSTRDLLASFTGIFTFEGKDFEYESKELAEDISKVTLTGGTITISADTAKLRSVLQAAPEVLDEQAVATLERYGFTLPGGLFIAESAPAGWEGQVIAEIERILPYTTTVDDLSAASGYDPSIVTVREEGRWYFSSLLTSGEWSGAQTYMGFAPKTADRGVIVPGVSHNNAVEAAQALATGLQEWMDSGDAKTFLQELPLAERRYVGLYLAPYLDMLGASRGAVAFSDAAFSEIKKEGNLTKLRIDSLTIGPPGGLAEASAVISKGSCITFMAAEPACLSDILSEGYLLGILGSYRYDDGFGEALAGVAAALGISSDDLYAKIETAISASVAALNTDDLGLVTVKDNDGWHVSIMATITDIDLQLLKAILIGLDSIAIK